MLCENVSSADNQQERFAVMQKSSETVRRISRDSDYFLSLVLGMLFTDGCVSPRKDSAGWRIYFSSKSSSLANHFRLALLGAFKLEPSKILIGFTSDGLSKVVVNSKRIGNFLVDTFGTFRTLRLANGQLPDANLPIPFLRETQTFKPFMKAAFSCDGGVSFYPVAAKRTSWFNRNVFLACKHPKLVQDYKTILNEIGVEVSVSSDRLFISNKDNIEKFYAEIGFLSDVGVTNHSVLWKNIPKQQVLESLIGSYQSSC